MCENIIKYSTRCINELNQSSNPSDMDKNWGLMSWEFLTK